MQYTIHPDNCRPVTFEGTIIASKSNRAQNSTRWSEANVYLTKGGTHVLVIESITCWQGESNTTTYLTFDNPEDLVACLESEYPFAASSIATSLNVTRTIP